MMNKLFAELRRRNVVRVAGVYAVIGWILAQVANTLEESMNLPGWFDGLIVALLIIGLPVALIFAWAFEMTPEGVKRTEAVDAGVSITAETGRKLDYAIVIGLALLAMLIVWQQTSGPGSDDKVEPDTTFNANATTKSAASASASVAVLPFADLSPNRDQEYFSDGISEEILNVLVGVDGLDVVSRTSSFQFKGRDLGIPDIAAQLKVRHVVEGSVRKAGDTLRITAQLIDAADDRHLWSETYDRPLTAENIFAIQDEIARSIVVALRAELGLEGDVDIAVAVTTENVTAYELYLQARPLFQSRKYLIRADTLLARAIELDPGYAKAWEMRAATQSLMHEYAYTQDPIDEVERRGVDFAQRALSFEPNSALAIAHLAKVRLNQTQQLRQRHDIAGIIADFDRALTIEPRDGSALNWRGLAYGMVGDLPSALRDFRLCVEYEPHYWPCRSNEMVTLAEMGRDDDALRSYEESLNIGVMSSIDAPLPALARRGDEMTFKIVTSSPGFLFGWRQHDELYHAYQNIGADHSKLIESILQFSAEMSAADKRNIDYLIGPFGAVESWFITIDKWDPTYSHLRQSAQFRKSIRNAGVLEYWQTHGFPPQCQPVGSDDFVCP